MSVVTSNVSRSKSTIKKIQSMANGQLKTS
jgi:hypothetical protein